MLNPFGSMVIGGSFAVIAIVAWLVVVAVDAEFSRRSLERLTRLHNDRADAGVTSSLDDAIADILNHADTAPPRDTQTGRHRQPARRHRRP